MKGISHISPRMRLFNNTSTELQRALHCTYRVILFVEIAFAGMDFFVAPEMLPICQALVYVLKLEDSKIARPWHQQLEQGSKAFMLFRERILSVPTKPFIGKSAWR